jgi:hypothetical protein
METKSRFHCGKCFRVALMMDILDAVYSALTWYEVKRFGYKTGR